MTAARAFRIVAQIQTLVLISRKPLPYFAQPKPIPLAYDSLRQPLRAKYGMLSLGSFAAPYGSCSSADRESEADAQIGGGMRVSDAFPAMVGLQLIAI
jgi:hypothetical protein